MTSHYPSVAQAIAQSLVDLVVDWAESEGISISPKSECTVLFRKTDGSAQLHHLQDEHGVRRGWGRISLRIGPFSRQPVIGVVRILGVWFDNSLNFSDHVRRLLTTFTEVRNRLTFYSSTWPTKILRQVYYGECLSRLTYACAAWYYHTTQETRDRLAAAHHSAARLITGAQRSANLPAVLAEADLRPLPLLVFRQAANRISQVRRLVPHGYPAALSVFRTVDTVTHHPLDKNFVPNWNEFFPAELSRQPCASMDRISTSDMRTLVTYETRFILSSPARKKAAKKAASLRNIDAAVAAMPAGALATTYSDGSVIPIDDHFPDVKSGAAATCHTGAAAVKAPHHTAGRMACSKSAEQLAFNTASSLLHDVDFSHTAAVDRHVMSVADSKSALSELANGPTHTRSSWMSIAWWRLRCHIQAHVSVVFIYGHCNIAEHDEVDKEAALAADDLASHELFGVAREDEARWVSSKAIHSADAVASAQCPWRQRWLTGASSKLTWQTTMLRLPNKCRLSRGDELVLGQLRTGAYPPIGGCVHGTKEECLACGAKVLRSGESTDGRNAVDHVFNCPASVHLRNKYQGISSPSVLFLKPRAAVCYVNEFVATYGSQLDRFELVE